MNGQNPSAEQNGGACSCGGACGGLDRRDFLKFMGATAVGALLARTPVMAGPFEKSDFEKMIPADKKLDPNWVKSLYARGERAVYRGGDLEKIGMPVGGICAGQVYLGGDGTLWHWDVLNKVIRTSDRTYANPPERDLPLAQGFALRVQAGDKIISRTLNRAGFPGVTFCGEYPIGTVEYKDQAVPVAVTLEAFSPFIPLNTEESSLPATVLRFTVKNTSDAAVEAELAGWLQNPVCMYTANPGEGQLVNRVRREKGLTMLLCGARPPKGKKQKEGRPPVVFADFEGKDYGAWKAEGEAFGTGPAEGSRPGQFLSNFEGKGLANTWTGSDKLHGKLISPEFTVERPYINFLIGGGSHARQTCINLIAEGKPVRTEVGKDSDQMEWATWEVRDLEGKTVHIEIVDQFSQGWGHIAIDQIEFSDLARVTRPFTWRHDYGTMALALLGGRAGDPASAMLSGDTPAEAVFASGNGRAEAVMPIEQTLVGTVGRRLKLAPGAEEVVAFAIAWHFPNWTLKGLKDVGERYYAMRFKDAGAVARHLAANIDSLYGQTKLWRDTWYDSTLPRWFLDRIFVPASTLATSTCYRLASGRFWAWEGVGCCHGTCGHVWQYAHSVARLFPELERDTRERVDFGLSFSPETGVIGFRGEFDMGLAVDAQAGTILRTYREHQMSPDDAFLRRNWFRVRKAFDPLLALDADRDGVMEGAQMNTLDRPWFGKIAWLSSMYVAALKAGEAMAHEMGDEEFAETCRAIAERGGRNIDRELFNGEYYYHIADPKNLKAVGSFDGCEIDQMLGQSWAHQVGLGDIQSQKNVRTALKSLWKYNFTPDVGPFREAHQEGRWYAMAGEAGLLMCSWPRGEGARQVGRFDYYFNECWTGTEYQVASHMMHEGMVQEALAVVRAAHDRHHPSRRNPYNEIECGEHYARAMSSHGVFISACGFQVHGPQGRLAFAPRLTPENFRAAFTAPEGWGTYAQKIGGGKMNAAVEVKWGKLKIKTLTLELPEGTAAGTVGVKAGGKTVQAKHEEKDGRVEITMPDVELLAGQKLEVAIG